MMVPVFIMMVPLFMMVPLLWCLTIGSRLPSKI